MLVNVKEVNAPSPADGLLIAATVIHLRSWKYFSPFVRMSNRVVKQAREATGIIRYGTAADFRSKMFFTCSVWQDRRAVNEFVRGEPHLTAMKRIGVWGGPKTAFTVWNAADGPIDWEEVRWRLEQTSRKAQPQ